MQLAKYFGAEVTGVCSAANIELVKSLGADRVVDYTMEDFTQGEAEYDIIFDTVGKSSFARCKAALKKQGLYMTPVLTMPVLWHMMLTARFGSKKASFAATGLRPASDKAKDMQFLKELIEAGKLRSIIDRRYPLEEIIEASRYVDAGHKKGNVVLMVNQSKGE